MSVATGFDENKPWLGLAVTLVLTVASGIMFIAVAARVQQHLNPAVLLKQLARDGWHAMKFDPAHFHGYAATIAGREVQQGHELRRSQHTPDANLLLAVNTARLLDLEDAWGIQIELVAGLGAAIPYDGLLFRTSAELNEKQRAVLQQTLAFGDILSPRTGPFGAIRAMVDIAMKAISPAVNDPTRAVQALDQIEDILTRLSPHVAKREAERLARPQSSMLREWTYTWEDYISAASDEIREFGTNSIQIQRRLRAMYETLIDICPPEQHPPLVERIKVLDAGVKSWWPDRLDRELAAESDSRGLARVHRDS